MSTFLIYTSPACGHLYPIMDVAIALRDAGHRVVVQTLADQRHHLEALGLEHRPIAAEVEALTLDDYQGSTPIAQFKAGFRCWLSRAPHEVTDLEESVRAVAPDLVVVDVNTWGAQAFAEASRKRWAMFMPFCLPVPDPKVPMFGPGFPPPASWIGRTRDRLVLAAMRAALPGEIARLDAWRRKLGVAPLGAYEEMFTRADVTLYRTSEPFDYARSKWPRGVEPIGPGLWAPPDRAPEWVHDLPRPGDSSPEPSHGLRRRGGRADA